MFAKTFDGLHLPNELESVVCVAAFRNHPQRMSEYTIDYNLLGTGAEQSTIVLRGGGGCVVVGEEKERRLIGKALGMS